MSKTQVYNVVASFMKISSAIDAVGVIKHKGIDDSPRVIAGEGQYHTVMGPFKAKKTAEDLVEQLHKQTTYTFKIEQEKA